MRKIVALVLTFGAIGAFVYYLHATGDSQISNLNLQKRITDSLQNTTSSESLKLINAEYSDTFTVESISRSSNGFYPVQSKLNPKYSVDRYIFTYTSQDTNENEIQIKGQLFIPQTSSGEQFPIYVFGQGTTGLGDQCAPSNEAPEISNWGNYRAHMLAYASQGFIVIFPDYEGFNDPNRIHHYFNSQLEANVLLDGTRAVFEFLDREDLAKPLDAVFYAGYSQGGHAAFAVKDQIKQYAPEIPIKGVIGYGATTDMIALLKENPTLAPYVFYAYEDLYGNENVKPELYLQEEHLRTFRDDVINICIGDIYEKYGYDAQSIYSESFFSALYGNNLDKEYPEFYKLLIENSSGLEQNDIPALVLQGSNDPIVTVSSQKKFLNKICQNQTKLTYIEYPGVHHYQTRQVGIKDSIEWMKNIINGNVPPSDCDNL